MNTDALKLLELLSHENVSFRKQGMLMNDSFGAEPLIPWINLIPLVNKNDWSVDSLNLELLDRLNGLGFPTLIKPNMAINFGDIFHWEQTSNSWKPAKADCQLNQLAIAVITPEGREFIVPLSVGRMGIFSVRCSNSNFRKGEPLFVGEDFFCGDFTLPTKSKTQIFRIGFALGKETFHKNEKYDLIRIREMPKFILEHY